MDHVYQFFLTFESCCWMLIVFFVKIADKDNCSSVLITALAIFVFSFLLTLFSLWRAKKLSTDSGQASCMECSLADGNFLPVYLGYFFVSLSAPTCLSMGVVFCIVFLFTFISGTQLFNPLFLLFGYHYYFVKTSTGTSMFLIKKGPVVRNASELKIQKLYRVNDSTYFC